MSIYSSDSEVISNGLIRLHIIMATYFTCGLMEIFVGGLRGLGSSFIPMLVSIFGVCGIRIVWILHGFLPIFHTLQTLYISYPISWCVTAAIQLACYIMYKKRVLKNTKQPRDIISRDCFCLTYKHLRPVVSAFNVTDADFLYMTNLKYWLCVRQSSSRH